ncbi:MAG: PKD domain-containing protein [Thermoplasmatota archaeon]
MARVEIRIDHGLWSAAGLAAPDARVAPWTGSLSLAGLAPGAHVVSIRASDGNAASVVREVTIGVGAFGPPPSLAFVAPPARAVQRGDDVLLSGAASGPAAITGVTATIDGTDAFDATIVEGATVTPWSLTLPTSGLAEGDHVVRIVAHDASRAPDDRSAALEADFTVAANERPPEVALAHPTDGATFSAIGGDAVCLATRPCVKFAGLVADPAAVATGLIVREDEANALPLADLPGATWAATPAGEAFGFEWPLSAAFAGEHHFTLTPVAPGVPTPTTEVRIALAGPRVLALTVVPARALTSVPLSVDALLGGASPAAISWRVDGGAALDPTRGLAFGVPGGHDVEAVAVDANGEPARALATVDAVDRPPVAALAPVGALATHTPATFDASPSSDADSNITAWRFDFGDGGNWSSAPRATHTFTAPGPATLVLTVRDVQGEESDALQVPLTIADAPPVADFSIGPGAVTEFVDATFSDTSLDPDGEPIASHVWEFGDGTGADGAANVSHRYAARGDFSVRLTVADPEGATATVVKNVHVADTAPEAAFTFAPNASRALDPVRFTDASTKLDGNIVRRSWSFGDGTGGDGVTLLHTFDAPGVYPVRLAVTDDAGLVANVTRDVTVLDAPPIVNATFTPRLPTALDEVTFLGYAHDIDGNVTRATWDFGDGTLANGTSATHTYQRAGAYAVRFTAVDDAGLSSAVTLLVRVADAPPVVSILAPSPNALAGLPSTILARASDPDGRIVRFDWSVDGVPVPDGATGGGAFTYTFPTVGTYRLRVVATDDANLTAEASRDVEAYPPTGADRPPILAVDFPTPNATVREVVRFAGSASSVAEISGVAFQLRDGAFVITPGGAPWEAALGREHWYIDFDTRGVPNGAYDVAFRVTDARGAWVDKVVPLTVANLNASDLDALALVVLSPAENATLSGLATFHGVAFHPDGVESVRARVDDEPWAAVQGVPGRWSFPVDTTHLANGIHTFDVRAFRGVAQWKDAFVDFTVQNDRPRLVLDHSLPDRVVGVFAVTGTLADTPASSVRFRIDDGLWQDAQGLPAWTVIVDSRTLDNGSHTLVIRATGANGLDGAPIIGTFVVENRPAADTVSPEAQAVSTVEHATPSLSMVAVVFVLLGAAVATRRRGRGSRDAFLSRRR